ncbi:MAG TPA: ABC transporter substrate-binding protein [Hyphomicrobiaceae bacterium]|nr:ABC transporter substrate-binding protein [Hyphomicrobiaceae bacterium]
MKRYVILASAATLAASAAAVVMPGDTLGQGGPKKGGTLNFAVVAEPPTIDCHAVSTFAFAHPGRPHYSTLLKFAGDYKNLKIVGDLAESYEMAKDGLTYTFKLHKGVKFHDGADMTSADIKASYDRIVNPPAGVTSLRKALHADIGSVETPDAHTVVFKMKRANASMLTHFASPWNCIYRAALLKEDPNFPAKKIVGTGPFVHVEYVKGSHWSGKRFDGYFRKDRPYLDGYKALFVKSAAVAPGMVGGQFDAEFRGRTPKERDQIMAGLKDKAVTIEGPWVTNLLFTFNTTKKPFDDERVRRALSMAIDRHGGSEPLSKISMLKYVSGLLRPGFDMGLPPAELEKLPGFSKDINKSREEAKKLLAEAGVPKLKVRLVNRNIDEPYKPGALFVIDQWRQIGVETEHVVLETKLFFDAMKDGNFDVLVEFISDFADDPSAQFDKLLTGQKSSQSASRHTDKRLDELFDLQAAAVDPAERRKLVHEFERHALTKAYSVPLLWWQRIITMHKKVKGWEHQANHFTGQDLGDVWLDQ